MIYIEREKLLEELSHFTVLTTPPSAEQTVMNSSLVENINKALPDFDRTVNDEEDLDSDVEATLSSGFAIESLTINEYTCTVSGSKALSMKISKDIIADTSYLGEVFGKHNGDSGVYFALFKNEKREYSSDILGDTSVGIIVTEKVYKKLKNPDVLLVGYDWFGAYIGGEWLFTAAHDRAKITVTDRISFVSTAFSRNLGLLETDIMAEKTAVVVGCGSVGSYIIMQLAKAGVGKFVFIEFDTLEIHNLSRHWLGLSHLGEYKADAMALEVKRVNPNACVKVFKGKVQDAPGWLFEGIPENGGIVIATGDNRACDAEANRIAERLSLPFLSVGCWTRATCGEVFTWMPSSGLPTYGEAFDGLITEETNAGHRAYFGSESEAGTVRFEPGIYSDITFVTDIGVKLALDMMNIGNENYTTRVYDHLTNYTLICNTNSEKLGGRHAALFPHPLRITTRRDGIWLRNRGDAACLTISLE